MGSGADMDFEEKVERLNELRQIRGEILDEAKGYIMRDRNSSYDEPERNFERIAMLWHAYLAGKAQGTAEFTVQAHDVAIMMTLMKIGRLAYNPTSRDQWVDACGYMACGAEVAGAK